MIGTLTGQVQSIGADAAIIEVGGVGFELRMPADQLSRIHSGQHVRAYTSLNVSQDSLTLYGFLDEASKTMFLRLQKVSGIGPRVALSILSVLTPDDLIRAVMDDDVKALSQAPGLGRKGAQKIILDLKGSVDLSQIETIAKAGTADGGGEQVIEGLMSLGWRQQDASNAVDAVCSQQGIIRPISGEDIPRVLKLALASLDRGR